MFLSDNNGLDWKEVASIQKSGVQKIGLDKFILRHYDYILRLVFHGPGTGLNRMRISAAIQCSQRALPTLAKGDNTITFGAGPQEGTITIEGTSLENAKGKNVSLPDYHPILKNVGLPHFSASRAPGPRPLFRFHARRGHDPLAVGRFLPASRQGGPLERLRLIRRGPDFQKARRIRGPMPGRVQVHHLFGHSFGHPNGPGPFQRRTAEHLLPVLARIDADYREPHGGFRPVKLAYVWEEGGIEKRDVHVMASPAETYTIRCESKPQMKSIVLDLDNVPASRP